MTPEETKKAEEYEKAVVRLKSKRNSLQAEILEELNRLSQNPDASLIRNEVDEAIMILEGNELIGEEVDRVSSALVTLSIVGIGDMEKFICQWDILYPIEIEIVIDNQSAIRSLLEAGD